MLAVSFAVTHAVAHEQVHAEAPTQEEERRERREWHPNRKQPADHHPCTTDDSDRAGEGEYRAQSRDARAVRATAGGGHGVGFVSVPSHRPMFVTRGCDGGVLICLDV